MNEATLPHRDNDAILTLYAHYFLAGDLMYENHRKLTKNWERRGRLSNNNKVHLSIYFCTWLGFLAVTTEGFKKLGVRSLLHGNRPSEFVELIPHVESLGKTIKKHDDALRRFRNMVFHMRDSTENLERFFSERPDRLEWADTLHRAFAEFFSEYRVLCQVHYLVHHRDQELIR